MGTVPGESKVLADVSRGMLGGPLGTAGGSGGAAAGAGVEASAGRGTPPLARRVVGWARFSSSATDRRNASSSVWPLPPSPSLPPEGNQRVRPGAAASLGLTGWAGARGASAGVPVTGTAATRGCVDWAAAGAGLVSGFGERNDDLPLVRLRRAGSRGSGLRRMPPLAAARAAQAAGVRGPAEEPAERPASPVRRSAAELPPARRSLP